MDFVPVHLRRLVERSPEGGKPPRMGPRKKSYYYADLLRWAELVDVELTDRARDLMKTDARPALHAALAARELGGAEAFSRFHHAAYRARWCDGHDLSQTEPLAALLEAGGSRVVISIGPADSAIAEALDRTGGVPGALPRFTGGLADLTVLLARANLVISNSTGPLHLAAAPGTPTLGFFAPWPTSGAVRWGPYAANGWALQADSSGVTRWSRARRVRSRPRRCGRSPSSGRALWCGGPPGRGRNRHPRSRRMRQ